MTISSPFSMFSIKRPETSNVKPFPKETAAETTEEVLQAEETAAEEAKDVSEVKVEETKEPVVEAPVEAAKEDITPEAEAPATRRRSKKTEETEEKAPDIIPVAYGAGKITLEDIGKKFVAIEDDLKWSEFESGMRKKLDDIKIKSDINLGSAKILIEQITDLYIELRRYKREINSMDKTFLDRTVGLIPRFKDVNSVGKNENERKRNIALALESFPVGKGKVNIADISLAVITRKEIIDEFMDVLEAKQSALYSYIGIFKAENKIFE